MAVLPRRGRGDLPLALTAVLAAGALAVLPDAAHAANGNLTYLCDYGTLATSVPTPVSIDTDAPATSPINARLNVSTTATLTMPRSVVATLQAIPGFTSVRFSADASTDGVHELYVAPNGSPTPVITHPDLSAGPNGADGVQFTGKSPAPYVVDPGPSTPGTYTIRPSDIAYRMDVVATTPATYRLSCTAPSNAAPIDTLAVTAGTTTTAEISDPTWSYGDPGPSVKATVARPGVKTGWPGLAGFVRFYADGEPVGERVAVTDTGNATLQHLPPLAAGAHTVSAAFEPGDGSFYTASTSALSDLAVDVATTTALTVSPPAPDVGDGATATATVRATDGKTPHGSVTFAVDGAALGTADLDDSGSAAMALPTDARGHYRVTASYGGDGAYRGSVSGPASLDVGVPVTTTTLSLDRGTVAYGERVTATATVSSPRTSPTGTVAFVSGGRTLSARVVDGRARLSLPVQPTGRHRVRATFRPDAVDAFIPSTSAAAVWTVIRDATTTMTRVRLTKHHTRPLCTVTVRATHGMPVDGKVSVTYKRRGKATVVRTATLVGGSATVRHGKVARHRRWSVATAYLGSASFTPSASTIHRGRGAR
jgi:hypothetical protein